MSLSLLNDDEFWAFCQQNGDLKLERSADGTILIMPNTGGETGDYSTLLFLVTDNELVGVESTEIGF